MSDAASQTPVRVIVLMGVSGSGKTEVGRSAAARLGWTFDDGDDFHPPANIARMAAGHPLDDEHRRPWLRRLASRIDERLHRDERGIVACSALKATYRRWLGLPRAGVALVHLVGSHELIAGRMAERRGHFFKSTMLDSQFADLESPDEREACIIPIDRSVDAVVDMMVQRLGLESGQQE